MWVVIENGKEMYIKVFSKIFPNYEDRMAAMSDDADGWMNGNYCNLELLPKA